MYINPITAERMIVGSKGYKLAVSTLERQRRMSGFYHLTLGPMHNIERSDSEATVTRGEAVTRHCLQQI